jgi:hypothetical protein
MESDFNSVEKGHWQRQEVKLEIIWPYARHVPAFKRPGLKTRAFVFAFYLPT